MSHLTRMIKKRRVRLPLACLLLTGAIAAPVLLSEGTAQAAACSSATPAGTACSLTGTFTLSAGALTLTGPSTLTWSTTLNGFDQQLTTGGTTYKVNDATGTGAGWHVTASATTFTTGSATLPDTGTFSTNGTPLSITNGNPPVAVCDTAAACTLPSDTTSYPVNLTTAASSPAALNIYDAGAGTGLGSIVIGSAGNTVSWWLNVPASATPGTYTSTVTMEVISGP